MAKIAMKFGGTSVADLPRIRHVAALVKREVERGHEVAVIVSAMAGETNKLVAWTNEAARPDPGSNVITQAIADQREYDVVVAAGEQVTAGLLAVTLNAMGIQARSWMGWQVPIQTSAVHGAARIEAVPATEMMASMARGEVAVVAGFQGVAPGSRISTLGRGGSDTSAVAVAAGIKAERCDIYTDVDGVYTTDPRIVPKARRLEKIAYRGNAGNGVPGRQGAADPLGGNRHAAPRSDAGAFDFHAGSRRNIALRRGRHRGKETCHRHRL